MSAVLASSSAFISLEEKKDTVFHFGDHFKHLQPDWPAESMEQPLHHQFHLGDKSDDMSF